MREFFKILCVSVLSATTGAIVQDAIRSPAPPPVVKVIPAPGSATQICPVCGGTCSVWIPSAKFWNRGEWKKCPTCGGKGLVPNVPAKR